MNYVIDECERGSFNCHGMMNVVGIRPTEFGYRRGKEVVGGRVPTAIDGMVIGALLHSQAR